jgi:hypothetical protein
MRVSEDAPYAFLRSSVRRSHVPRFGASLKAPARDAAMLMFSSMWTRLDAVAIEKKATGLRRHRQ